MEKKHNENSKIDKKKQAEENRLWEKKNSWNRLNANSHQHTFIWLLRNYNQSTDR
jgi:hypothetical protein